MHLSHPVAWAAVRSKAVVPLLLIRSLVCFSLVFGGSVFIFFAVHNFVSFLVLHSS